MPARGLGQAPDEQQHSSKTAYLSFLSSVLSICGLCFSYTQLPHQRSLRSSETQHSSRSDAREVPTVTFAIPRKARLPTHSGRDCWQCHATGALLYRRETESQMSTRSNR